MTAKGSASGCRRIAAWVLATVALGCSPSPLTQLVVDVEIDPAIAASLTGVDLLVTSPTGTVRTVSFAPSSFTTSAPTLGVLSRGGALEPVRIEAHGHRMGTDITDRVITGFVRDETRLVVLVLGVGCAAGCATDQRCVGGACVDAHVAASDLPPFDGTAPAFDAAGPTLDAGSMPDAGAMPDAAVTGPDCIFTWDCGVDHRCVSDATGHGHCVSAVYATGGMPCRRRWTMARRR